MVAAAILHARGFDVVTTRDAGHLGRSDADQLVFAADAGRLLLSHNRADFERLHRQWSELGRSHAGIVIARRRSPSELAARVGRLLSRLTAEEMKNQVLYV